MRKSKVAKLSGPEAKRVLALYLYGKMTQTQIARQMKISQTAVSMIIRGVTYKWATGFKAA